MTQMTNQETDTALILEKELTRRVREIMQGLVWEIVDAEFKKRFDGYKQSMMMEIAIAVGNMIRVAGEENRKPLWEYSPEEFGLSKKDLNTHRLNTPQIQVDPEHIYKEITDALRKQTPPL